MDNPWQVESIQVFSILKCPECFFDTKDENKFEDHAVANHPMSYVLFGKSEKDIIHSSEGDLEDSTVHASTFDKEDSEKYLQEENYCNFVEVDHIKEEPLEDFLDKTLIAKHSIFSEKEDQNPKKETSKSKHIPIKEISKKTSNKKQKFVVKVEKCSSCDFVTNCSSSMSEHTSISHRNINCFNYYCSICDYGSNYKGSFKTHMGSVHKLELSEKGIACFGLEQRNGKNFILDNTIAEKLILENQNAPPESKEEFATEKVLLEDSVQMDGKVSDNNFVEVGKIKEEPSIESLDEQNPIKVSKVEFGLFEESMQIDKEVVFDDNFVEVGKIKEDTIENLVVEPSVESLNEQNPIEVSHEIKNKNLDHLKKHIQCNLCGLSFKKTTLQRHINEVHERVHEEVYNYQCRLCNYGSDYKDCLKSHLKLLHNIEESKTELDKYRTGHAANEIKLSQEREERRLERISKKQELIKCDQCELTIYPATKKSLNRHIATVHKEEQPPSHNCPNCSKSFDDVTQLEKHLECFCFDRRVKPKFAKPSSEMDPLSNDSLTSVNDSVKFTKPSSVMDSLSNDSLTSENDSVKFAKPSSVMAISNDHLASENDSVPVKIDKKLNSCHLCSYKHEKEIFLKIHLESHSWRNPMEIIPLNEGDILIDGLPFKCSLCDFSSNTLERTKIHMKHHSQCSSCEEIFHVRGLSLTEDFKNHIHNHHKNHPKKNPPKLVKLDDKKHKVIMSVEDSFDEQNYKKRDRFHCLKCKKSWSYQSGLELHMKKCHGVDVKEMDLNRRKPWLCRRKRKNDLDYKGSQSENDSYINEILDYSDRQQEKLQKMEEENIETSENTVDGSATKNKPNLPSDLPAQQSPSIPENQPKKRNRKQTMAERQTF